MRRRLQSGIVLASLACLLLAVEGQVRIPGFGSGRGMHNIAWAQPTGVEGDSVVIKPGQSLFLEPNVPNPFDKATTIAYTLDRETPVTLRVFDAFYNDVRTLVDAEVQTPGRYEIEFVPVGEFSSAMYFYSLTTDAGTETRRMLLVR